MNNLDNLDVVDLEIYEANIKNIDVWLMAYKIVKTVVDQLEINKTFDKTAMLSIAMVTDLFLPDLPDENKFNISLHFIKSRFKNLNDKEIKYIGALIKNRFRYKII